RTGWWSAPWLSPRPCRRGRRPGSAAFPSWPATAGRRASAPTRRSSTRSAGPRSFRDSSASTGTLSPPTRTVTGPIDTASGARRVQPHGGEVGPGRPGGVSPAVDPGGPLERVVLPQQRDQGRIPHDPLVDLGPQGRPAVPVGLGQGPVDQPVHLRVVVLAEVVAQAEAAVVLGQDRLAGVVPEVVRNPAALPELVLQALGGGPQRPAIGFPLSVG